MLVFLWCRGRRKSRARAGAWGTPWVGAGRPVGRHGVAMPKNSAPPAEGRRGETPPTAAAVAAVAAAEQEPSVPEGNRSESLAVVNQPACRISSIAGARDAGASLGRHACVALGHHTHHDAKPTGSPVPCLLSRNEVKRGGRGQGNLRSHRASEANKACTHERSMRI